MRKGAIWALALLLAVAAVGGAAAQEGTATVTVVHGVPGVPVDVYVNNELTLQGFQPKTITDPLQLAPGTYRIDIRRAGDPATADPIISATASLRAGQNVSLVAHLTAAGEPTLTAFSNDVSAVPAGQGRVTVRHTAAAPAVDILVNGRPAITGLTNPNEATATLAAATYQVAVAPAGTTDPVLGPAGLPVQAGTLTIVYAIGSLDQGTLDLLVQTISGLGAAPGVVPTGTGSLASGGGFPLWAGGLLLVAAGGLAVSGYAMVRQRR